MMVNDIMETIHLIQLIFGRDPEIFRFKHFKDLYEKDMDTFVVQ